MKFDLEKVLNRQTIVNWLPRLVVAVILAQTLPFKFSGAEESVAIFTQLNMEPYGRIGIGMIELVAVILLISRYYILGALISLSIISAANFLHFVKLGLEVNNDGGTLFILSLVVIACSLWIIVQWNIFRKKKVSVNFGDFGADEDESGSTNR